jgi:hypothetical protein
MVYGTHRWVKVVALGSLCMTVVSLGVYFHDYWVHYPTRSADSWQYGYQQAAEYLGQPEFAHRIIYVENLDRLYLYFLFFNKIPPQLIQNKGSSFSFSQFERYRFVSVNQALIDALPNGDMVMVRALHDFSTRSLTLVDIIPDYLGAPLYAIYEK